jgi:hypothetical protein
VLNPQHLLPPGYASSNVNRERNELLILWRRMTSIYLKERLESGNSLINSQILVCASIMAT